MNGAQLGAKSIVLMEFERWRHSDSLTFDDFAEGVAIALYPDNSDVFVERLGEAVALAERAKARIKEYASRAARLERENTVLRQFMRRVDLDAAMNAMEANTT